jgi:hypothetical protein
MIKRMSLTMTLVVGVTFAHAQQETDVRNVIDKMFVAMIKGDSALLHTTFNNTCVLMTVVKKPDGSTAVVEGPLQEFLNYVGSPRKSKIEERLLGYDIKIDGDMAMAWTPYQFFVDDKLSHCGVNVFLLAKTGNDWKIINITDTRRKNCE